MSAPLVHAKPAGKIVFQKEDSWKEKCFSRIDSHDLNFAVIFFTIRNNMKFYSYMRKSSKVIGFRELNHIQSFAFGGISDFEMF